MCSKAIRKHQLISLVGENRGKKNRWELFCFFNHATFKQNKRFYLREIHSNCKEWGNIPQRPKKPFLIIAAIIAIWMSGFRQL
jgi:hypothetical protein